jgi:hypothetical protein
LFILITSLTSVVVSFKLTIVFVIIVSVVIEFFTVIVTDNIVIVVILFDHHHHDYYICRRSASLQPVSAAWRGGACGKTRISIKLIDPTAATRRTA